MIFHVPIQLTTTKNIIIVIVIAQQCVDSPHSQLATGIVIMTAWFLYWMKILGLTAVSLLYQESCVIYCVVISGVHYFLFQLYVPRSLERRSQMSVS